MESVDILSSRYDRENIYTRWLEAVQEYSARRLSFESDRMPAVSGLAAIFGSITKDEYLIGHWRKDLGRSLCWVPDSGVPSVSTFLKYPTWSWLSWSGPVQYDFAKSDTFFMLSNYCDDSGFEILSIGEQVRGRSSSSSVSHLPKLRLKALISRGRLKRSGARIFFTQSGVIGEENVFRETDLHIGLDPGKLDKKVLEAEAMLLRVGEWQYLDEHRLPSHSTYRGLVLFPEGDGLCRRVGVYWQNGPRRFTMGPTELSDFTWSVEETTLT
ncbi:hypothetical protein V8E54_003824 [Elaphomyces granulatus]